LKHDSSKTSLFFIKFTWFIQKTKKRNQNGKKHRKVIWFNPPYSANVHTMLQPSSCQSLISIFKNADLGKYFNRLYVKVSYSCMGNMESLNAVHNRKIIRQERENLLHQKTRKNVISEWVARCPLKGKCLTQSITYKVKVPIIDETSAYIGLTSNTVIERCLNHTKSFNLKKY